MGGSAPAVTDAFDASEWLRGSQRNRPGCRARVSRISANVIFCGRSDMPHDSSVALDAQIINPLGVRNGGELLSVVGVQGCLAGMTRS
jgi:hypothetical protein